MNPEQPPVAPPTPAQPIPAVPPQPVSQPLPTQPPQPVASQQPVPPAQPQAANSRTLIEVPVGNKGYYFLIGSGILLVVGFFTFAGINILGGILGGLAAQGGMQTRNTKLRVLGTVAALLNIVVLILAYAVRIIHGQ